jgi:hypothetical protein
VASILRTFFDGYSNRILYWAPLLTYAIARGHRFVAVDTESRTAMPVPPNSESWKNYDFHSFADDGLTVVKRSEDSVAELASQGYRGLRQAAASFGLPLCQRTRLQG